MIYICFTADHELFSGQNLSTFEDIVIRPTATMMSLLEKYDVKATLFTDVCSIWRHRENGRTEFPLLMERQMTEAVARKHDVQLHLHPHWLKAEYQNEVWNYPPSAFRLHSLSAEEIAQLVDRGKRYLENLLHPVNPNYRCTAFRAGGWCLQPERDILKALLASDIKIDSTVYHGGFNRKDMNYFDFRSVPHGTNWWIDPEQGIYVPVEAGKDRIFEVSIGSYNRWPNKLIWKLKNRANKKKYASDPVVMKGKSLDHASETGTGNRWKFNDHIKQPIMLTCDGWSAEIMQKIVRHYVAEYRNSNQDHYISFICHPKNMDRMAYAEIDRFLHNVRENYSDQVQFITLLDVANKMNL